MTDHEKKSTTWATELVERSHHHDDIKSITNHYNYILLHKV